MAELQHLIFWILFIIQIRDLLMHKCRERQCAMQKKILKDASNETKSD